MADNAEDRSREEDLGEISISKAAFRRLPRYHQILSAFQGFGKKYISSGELSEILEINETLVRKDMADLRIRGKQNQGYMIDALLKRIGEFLGLQEITEAVLVGAGHLGQALAQFQDFEHYGLRIVGVLDNNPAVIGSQIGGLQIRDIDELCRIISERKIKLLILTTPKTAAQEVTDLVVACGVRAIWNFTPQELTVPEGVYIRNEQIVAGFMAVSHFLKNLGTSEEHAP